MDRVDVGCEVRSHLTGVGEQADPVVNDGELHAVFRTLLYL
jgi:hypothetical protein